MSEEHLIWVERTSWCSYFRARLRWSRLRLSSTSNWITLSVLCDQIVPLDEPTEGEAKVTCARWSWHSSQKMRGGPS
ncbi:hypothetical protein BGW80DRAFT_1407485 [Lactifluus volemus]|nr:hypothetical protein BGW80DRAFT_1407485 [Lactifluus volemus]